MTDDVLMTRARYYLRERIRKALELAELDVSKMLRATQAAETDHAFHCSQFAVALIYDVVNERGRPTWERPGSISQSPCPSFDDVAKNIAHSAAKAALAAIGSSEGKPEQP